jgi:hypothetical protein
MPKGSNFDDLARQVAINVDAAHAAGEQMTFLPDEPQAAAAGGRTPRGQGKITSQLREWCAARGLRLPEQILIEMAGMASGQDAFITAMQRAEQVLAWAEAGGTGYKGSPVQPSMAQRVQVFQFVYTAQLRAAEALLPYGLGKVTPDATPQTVVQVTVASPARVQAGPAGAKDITPQDRFLGPPNAPGRMQQNQQVMQSAASAADSEGRTE